MDTDEVHDLIETERMHFVLSGLSGRKLKRSGEALVRNFVDLARFLHVTSVCNGQQLKFANVSCDTGVPATSFTGCRNRTHTTAGWMTETHFANQVANQVRVRGIAWGQPHNLAVRRIGYVGVICGQWHMNESECAIDLCPSLAHV